LIDNDRTIYMFMKSKQEERYVFSYHAKHTSTIFHRKNENSEQKQWHLDIGTWNSYVEKEKKGTKHFL
jgi:hypothetical protein